MKNDLKYTRRSDLEKKDFNIVIVDAIFNVTVLFFTLKTSPNHPKKTLQHHWSQPLHLGKQPETITESNRELIIYVYSYFRISLNRAYISAIVY